MYSFIRDFRDESIFHAQVNSMNIKKLLEFDDVEKREPNLETSI